MPLLLEVPAEITQHAIAFLQEKLAGHVARNLPLVLRQLGR